MKNCLSTLLLLLFCLLSSSLHAQTWNNVNGFGSAPGEAGRGVCTDATGNVFYIGTFGSTIDFDPTGGTTNLVSAGSSDIVVSKYNASGVFQWAVRAGGTTLDAGLAIATDGTNIFITGTYTGTANFGATPLTTIGGTEVFLAKLTTAGAFSWAVSIGGALGGESVQGICVDGTGNPVILGTYFGGITIGATVLSATGDALGSSDLFVAKFNTANGAVLWASGGGSSAAGDNANGAGICYVPGLSELVLTGTYAGAATYGGVSLPYVSNNDLFILEMNATTGAFISGVNVGGAGNVDGLAICYDAATQDVMVGGFFDGANATFGSTVLTNTGDRDVFVARYAPATNTWIWAVTPTAGGSLDDRIYGIASDAQGMIVVTGQFETSLTLGATPLTALSPAGFSDIFVAGLAASTGAWTWAAQAGSNDGSFDEIGRGVSIGGTLKKIGMVGQYAGAATFGAITPAASAGSTDLFFAQLTAPLVATVTGTNATCVNGCNGSATVAASGGTSPYTYSWSPSGGSAATATGLCVGTYTVTITPAVGASIQRNVVIGLPTTQLAATATNNTGFSVNASNTNIYDASCNLIATVTPNGVTPVTGTVTARVWFEGGAPVYGPTGQVYVSRHYEIQPATNAANAMARITLYFTQAEFTAFNSAPASVLDLPIGPVDNARKANLRVTKLNGISNNGTGLPGTYTNGGTLIDPVDTDIIWNATASRWEVSFNVTGFSGFFVQTSLSALPLTWLDLKGYLDAEEHTVIDWKVDEQQVVSYSIEKSVNGQPFVAIGNIASAGNGEHTYSFRDPQALAGTATYRIKQTDLDGRYTYSRSILVKPNRNAWITLYPNPVKQTATLNITDPSLMNTPALLVDGAGRLVQRIQIQQTVTTINMMKCNPGIYMLRLQDGTNIKIFKE
jgi:hypothetical protein